MFPMFPGQYACRCPSTSLDPVQLPSSHLFQAGISEHAVMYPIDSIKVSGPRLASRRAHHRRRECKSSRPHPWQSTPVSATPLRGYPRQKAYGLCGGACGPSFWALGRRMRCISGLSRLSRSSWAETRAGISGSRPVRILPRRARWLTAGRSRGRRLSHDRRRRSHESL